MKYELLSSGDEKKIEQFGDIVIERPCSAALWKRKGKHNVDALFSREEKKGWSFNRKLPKSWEIELEGVRLHVKPTDFGHVGVFPEHAMQWPFLKARAKGKVLNLFAYSGATTLFLAKHGCEVTHVDAAKGMVDWAKENAELNGISSVRWIVDDVMQFLKREARRGNTYDGVVFDPPSFGRGSKGQVFKIERDINPLLGAIRNVLSKEASCVLFTCHTPGIGPLCMEHLLADHMPKGDIASGEMSIDGDRPLPSGTYARWHR